MDVVRQVSISSCDAGFSGVVGLGGQVVCPSGSSYWQWLPVLPNVPCLHWFASSHSFLRPRAAQVAKGGVVVDEVIKNSTLQLAEQKNPKAHSDSTSNSAGSGFCVVSKEAGSLHLSLRVRKQLS